VEQAKPIRTKALQDQLMCLSQRLRVERNPDTADYCEQAATKDVPSALNVRLASPGEVFHTSSAIVKRGG